MDDVLGCRKVTSGVMMAELPNPDQLERNYARPLPPKRDIDPRLLGRAEIGVKFLQVGSRVIAALSRTQRQKIGGRQFVGVHARPEMICNSDHELCACVPRLRGAQPVRCCT